MLILITLNCDFMKRWRWRKITPEKLKEMKELRKQGLTYRKIADILNISLSTAMYHLNPKTKENTLKRANEWNRTHRVKSSWKRNPDYIRDYMRERYRNDSEFRERVKKHMKNYYRRNQ